MKKIICALAGLAALWAVLYAVSPLSITITCTPDKPGSEGDD